MRIFTSLGKIKVKLIKHSPIFVLIMITQKYLQDTLEMKKKKRTLFGIEPFVYKGRVVKTHVNVYICVM